MPAFIQEAQPFTFNHHFNDNRKRLGIDQTAHPPPKRQELSALQDKFISDTMKDIREKALADVTRLGPVTACSKRASKKRDRSRSDDGDNGIDSWWTGAFLDQLGRRSGIAQMVATSGGLVTYWNKAFSNIVSSLLLRDGLTLTIFDLIEPKSLPRLYGMLALALHDNEDSSPTRTSSGDGGCSRSSHLSVTLPCRKFDDADSTVRHHVTIVFMEELRSRCFLGILTPSSSLPPLSSCLAPSRPSTNETEMMRLDDSTLCRTMFGITLV